MAIAVVVSGGCLVVLLVVAVIYLMPGIFAEQTLMRGYQAVEIDDLRLQQWKEVLSLEEDEHIQYVIEVPSVFRYGTDIHNIITDYGVWQFQGKTLDDPAATIALIDYSDMKRIEHWDMFDNIITDETVYDIYNDREEVIYIDTPTEGQFHTNMVHYVAEQAGLNYDQQRNIWE